MEKQILRISTAGSVDDGKSTLIGRLLFDSKNLSSDDIERIRKTSNIEGDLDYSLFTDGLKDEKEQGITIDVAYRYFTTQERKYIISDTPGHISYTRNMITGGSLSNVTMILIDSTKGVTEQTKRHLFLSSLLRIDHIILCVNKMDLVGYSISVFKTIKNDILSFSSKLLVKDVVFIPISALKGDNIINTSTNMDWYKGATLMHTLDNIHVSTDINKTKSRMFIQCVSRTSGNENRFLQGKINSGIFRVGDDIMVFPNRSRSKIISIRNGFNEVDVAYSPMSVSIEISDDLDVGRGDMITKLNSLPREEKEIESIICWMSNSTLDINEVFRGVRISENFKCKISEIKYKYNIEDLSRMTKVNEIKMNDIFKCKLKLSKTSFFDSYGEVKDSGSFIIIDKMNNTVGCGMIV